MRTPPISRVLGALAAIALSAAPMEVQAQETAAQVAESAAVPAAAGYANPIPPGAGAYGTAYANPFVNPSFNPYLNPYMTAIPMDPDLGLLYLLEAQNVRGGLGSGRLSGVRAAQAGTDRRRPASVPPTMVARPRTPARRPSRAPYSVGGPTAGAGQYFQRLPDRGGSAADYFGRTIRRTPQP